MVKRAKLFAVAIVIAALVALTVNYFAPKKQYSVFAQQGPENVSRGFGTFDSTQYSKWGASIIAGNTATGSQTITVCPAYQSLLDGRIFNPFFTPSGGVFAPILVDPQSSTVSETVTPTAVSIINAPPTFPGGNPATQCANITASFSNLHGSSLAPNQVLSGDFGIQEAINDAAFNGGGNVYWQIDSGTLALNTGGQTTNASTIKIPTRSVVQGASLRVLTTITGCAGGWSLGFSTGTEFSAANTTLTAGTTTDSSTLVPNVAFNAAATVPIVFCTTGTATAGVVHARYWGVKLAPPAN